MKYSENILEIAVLKPDYLGFIFYERSPRSFSGEIPEIDLGIKKTGVFVDADIEFILEKVKKYNFKAIQLHGKESADYCQELKLALDEDNSAEILKVFSVNQSFDFHKLQPYEGVVDYFLFDTKGENKGGNGIVFNWEVLKDYPSNTPFILSGGIGLDEIENINKLVTYFKREEKSHLLYAVDVNSKFELEAGLKNQKQLKLFKENLG